MRTLKIYSSSVRSSVCFKLLIIFRFTNKSSPQFANMTNERAAASKKRRPFPNCDSRETATVVKEHLHDRSAVQVYTGRILKKSFCQKVIFANNRSKHKTARSSERKQSFPYTEPGGRIQPAIKRIIPRFIYVFKKTSMNNCSISDFLLNPLVLFLQPM